MSGPVLCNVYAEEWYPIPIPETGPALEGLSGDWHKIDPAIIERWRTAAHEFHAACEALAQAGGWKRGDCDWRGSSAFLGPGRGD